MKMLDVFNMALDVLNLEPITQEQLTAGTEPIVITLKRLYGTAIRKASRERNWTFLTEKISLEGDDLGSGLGYLHSYELPDNLFRLCDADGGEYRRVGTVIYTNGEPTIYAITMEEDNKGNFYFGQEDLIPEDFYDLVALLLALLASPRLSSGDSKTQLISSLYNSLLNSLVSNDISYEMKTRARTQEALEEEVL